MDGWKYVQEESEIMADEDENEIEGQRCKEKVIDRGEEGG